MYPKYSDVFSEYAKIALEQGLISNAEDDSPKEEKKEEKKELSNAEIFYGVKNKPVKELLEEAHPKTIVMGPAYDKFNGVVENLQQRHKVMTDIALKNPGILQTNTRYVKAQQELINETIKLGFYLDNLHHDSLMKLADSCTESLNKVAALPAAGALGGGATVGLVAAIAGIVGLAAMQHFPQSQGIIADLNTLIIELEEAVNDYEELGQFVTGYTANIEKAATQIERLNSYLDVIESKYIKGESIVDPKRKNQYFKNLSQQVISQGIDQKVQVQSKSIIRLLDTIQGAGKNIKRVMLRAPKKYEEAENPTLKGLETVFHTVVPSDVKDVANRIEMLVKSSQEYKRDLQQQISNIENMKESLDQESLDGTALDLDEEEEDALGPSAQPPGRRPSKRPAMESGDEELINALMGEDSEDSFERAPSRQPSYDEIMQNRYNWSPRRRWASQKIWLLNGIILPP